MHTFKYISSNLEDKFNNLDINYCNPTDIYTKFEQIIIWYRSIKKTTLDHRQHT